MNFGCSPCEKKLPGFISYHHVTCVNYLPASIAKGKFLSLLIFVVPCRHVTWYHKLKLKFADFTRTKNSYFRFRRNGNQRKHFMGSKSET